MRYEIKKYEIHRTKTISEVKDEIIQKITNNVFFMVLFVAVIHLPFFYFKSTELLIVFSFINVLLYAVISNVFISYLKEHSLTVIETKEEKVKNK